MCCGDETWKPRQNNALPCTVQTYLLDIYFHFQINSSSCLIYPPCSALSLISHAVPTHVLQHLHNLSGLYRQQLQYTPASVAYENRLRPQTTLPPAKA